MSLSNNNNITNQTTTDGVMSTSNSSTKPPPLEGEDNDERNQTDPLFFDSGWSPFTLGPHLVDSMPKEQGWRNPSHKKMNYYSDTRIPWHYIPYLDSGDLRMAPQLRKHNNPNHPFQFVSTNIEQCDEMKKRGAQVHWEVTLKELSVAASQDFRKCVSGGIQNEICMASKNLPSLTTLKSRADSFKSEALDFVLSVLNEQRISYVARAIFLMRDS